LVNSKNEDGKIEINAINVDQWLLELFASVNSDDLPYSSLLGFIPYPSFILVHKLFYPSRKEINRGYESAISIVPYLSLSCHLADLLLSGKISK
jgi:hypothetical protein